MARAYSARPTGQSFGSVDREPGRTRQWVLTSCPREKIFTSAESTRCPTKFGGHRVEPTSKLHVQVAGDFQGGEDRHRALTDQHAQFGLSVECSPNGAELRHRSVLDGGESQAGEHQKHGRG
jgi:hypothetical protein